MKPALSKLPASTYLGYAWAILIPMAGSLLLGPMHAGLDLSNVALLYVLAVVVIAVRFGQGPAVVGAIACALWFAYIFVPPHFSLAITELQYLLSAVIMLVVALLVGHLTARMKAHSDRSLRRSQESAILYELAQDLAGAAHRTAVSEAAARFFGRLLDARQWQLYDCPAPEGGLAWPSAVRQAVEQGSFISRPLGEGRFAAYVPLFAREQVIAVLAFEAPVAAMGSADAVRLIETAASVIALALERARFAEEVQVNEVRHAAESLRNSILAALSHDLRTPLTALVGMAETVSLGKISAERQRHMLEGIRNQAHSISQQMTKLLDMARLSAGKLELNRAWQGIEEVIGTTLQLVKAQWREREVSLDLPVGLQPVEIDAVLMERVLWNLLENAVKYSPADAPIEITARQREGFLQLEVCDAGPGLPEDQLEQVFELFKRGRQESHIPGVGLGLSIAKCIVEAHGGELTARNRAGGGSCFRIMLPLGQAPGWAIGEPGESESLP